MIESNLDPENLKVSDVIIQSIADTNVGCVFGVSGGAALHLLNSVVTNPRLSLITTHHEQAAAMAADSYARVSGNLGVAIATSGPGATNLLTGIAGCFYDSVPAVFITGQVSTTRQSGTTGTRQIGFQETPIVQMVQSITKYAVKISDPRQVKEEIEKCIYIAREGRPGPTLIDIPDDIQRMFVTELELSIFEPPQQPLTVLGHPLDHLDMLAELIRSAKRPIFVCGSGIHLAGREEVMRDYLNDVGWPTLLTWGAASLLDDECPIRVGTFGTHGTRIGNLAVQNADLIVSIGSRLDTKATGSPITSFAPSAKIVMIDVDNRELEKFSSFGKSIDLKICMNLRDDAFLQTLNEIRDNASAPTEWQRFITSLKDSIKEDRSDVTTGVVEPYRFIEALSEATPEFSRVFIDTGCAIAWTMQSWKVKKNSRLFHDFNNTAMGWALPAAIGSLAESPKIKTLAIIGDGSFMMSMQEMATLKSISGELCIFLINNSGYSMIKQTQDQWFDGAYFASNVGEAMNFPNFAKLAESFGLNYEVINSESDVESTIKTCLSNSGSTLCEVVVSSNERVVPQVRFGRPIHDMDPAFTAERLASYLLNSGTNLS
jgi:acetolactate synthase-1/2/3 large subunit